MNLLSLVSLSLVGRCRQAVAASSFLAGSVVPVNETAESLSLLRYLNMPPLRPLRALAYGDLPCSPSTPCKTGLPSEDVVQDGYEPQWGISGRNDLGTMKLIGANAVRLYHSMGLGSKGSHLNFLDRAEELGLNVMSGVHSNHPELCPDFDCFNHTKQALLTGFKQGFQAGDQWHPAVAAVILANEPDFYEFDPRCNPSGAWCRVKAVLSAFDGALAAEQEAGVAAGRVLYTVTWSFAVRSSLDGKVTGPGLFGFQDMQAAVGDPSIVQYSPRTSQSNLQTSYEKRWVNGLNTQAPWSFVSELVAQSYAPFKPTPWFIGEYGANGQPFDVIVSDLKDINDAASKKGGAFLGAAFFQFQSAYDKGGSELNFGMFSLGDRKIGETGQVCDMFSQCKSWPVHCLKTDLPWLSGARAQRAAAVAAAWTVNDETFRTSSVSRLPGFC